MSRYCILFSAGALVLVTARLTAGDAAPSPLVPAAGSVAAAAVPPGGSASTSMGSAAPTVSAETVVLAFNGRSYSAAEFDRIVAAMTPPGTPNKPSVRRQVMQMFAEIQLLSAEAVRRGLDKDPRVQESLKIAHDRALGQAVAYHIAEGILENEARAQYEANKSGYEQIKARHILIRTPDSPVPLPPGRTRLTDEQARAKAADIRQRLLRGEDFGALAREMSDDLDVSTGGELPPFRRMQMIPEFENAAFSLAAGEISEPVKTPFGYHIIQVMERAPAPYDEVRTEIAQRLEQDVFQKFLEGLKNANPPAFEERYFGPPHPESPPRPSSVLVPRGSR